MKRIRQLDPRVISCTLGTPVQLAIGYQEMWITAIDMQIVVSQTVSGSPAPFQDWLPRNIAGLTIQDGGRAYVAWTGAPDIRAGYWGVRARHQGRFRPPDWVTGTNVFTWNLPLVFSPEPQLYDDQTNWWDPRVGIMPSAGLSMTVNWAATGTTGTTMPVTASKTYVQLTYYGIIPEPGDQVPQFYPNWQTFNYTPQSAAQALQSVLPFNPGPYYRRVHQLITKGAQSGGADLRQEGYTNSSGTMTQGGNISEVGLVTADKRNPVWMKLPTAARSSQESFQVSDDNTYDAIYDQAAASYGVSSILAPYNPAVVSWDLAKFLKLDPADPNAPVFGVNSAGKSATSLQLGYTVDTTANTPNAQIFQEAYLHY